MLGELCIVGVKRVVLKRSRFVSALVCSIEEGARMLSSLVLQSYSSLKIVVSQDDGGTTTKQPALFPLKIIVCCYALCIVYGNG